MTLHSFLSVFQLDGFFDFVDRPVREVQFNTHGFLADFYLDFGVLGVVCLSYLLGMLVKLSYVLAVEKPDVLSQSAWLCVGFASFMLFFSNHFTGLSYPLLSVILFSSYRGISRSMQSGT
jgi:oligosaccharide repeat unit polymerase